MAFNAGVQAGWRKGSKMSDTFSVARFIPVSCLWFSLHTTYLDLTLLLQPRDFADVPGERLSADLQADVQFGSMVRVYLNLTDMNADDSLPEAPTAGEVTPLLSDNNNSE